ncbi:uncharacterized protein [Elaeis guineensis]|uniref:Uncharacterized protein LOC105036655 n=1 Tax=Elaeis guineensis var. tenera TaxID=51953 RepID=A0A6I9QMK8_ELAGV|nr:uncharacterized protein LOC105036655 [Elaeis guineensis]
MAMSTDRSPLLQWCSLSMGLLFAYSATVQLNDPDWYFWFPLYALASGVNLLRARFTTRILDQVALLDLWVGVVLLLKVVVEAHLYGLAGFWSLDMRERAVREKLGCGLVAISMFLHIKASQASKETRKGKKEQAAGFVESGMAILVAVSFGVSVYFYVFVRQHTKF